MIAFDLECSKGHAFEGWFKSADSFEEQSAKGLIACPYCEDKNVKKILSPVTMRISQPDEPPRHNDKRIDYRRLAKEIVDYIDRNFEDVGANFAKEALRMHYGVAEKKGIRGSATGEEEEMLKDEGIHFFKVPAPKIDKDEKK